MTMFSAEVPRDPEFDLHLWNEEMEEYQYACRTLELVFPEDPEFQEWLMSGPMLTAEGVWVYPEDRVLMEAEVLELIRRATRFRRPEGDPES